MKIYEYQAKEVFCKYGIEVPSGGVASSVDEALKKSKNLDYEVALKSQVHVGGRGKAGGIKFAKNKDQVKSIANELLSKEIKGEQVNKLLIEEQKNINKELYLGVTLNRNEKTDTLIFSTSGGVDIEEVAEKNPQKVIKVNIDPVLGLQKFHLIPIAEAFKFNKKVVNKIFPIARKLYNIYKENDCLLVEINPLAILQDSSIIALDGKLEMDDNAGYRQEELLAKKDLDKQEPLELLGEEKGFVVIKLSGNISIISNGAGLAITTLDSLERKGRKAANILDLGGGATAEKVKKAVDVVLEDEDVNAILFNIFGGITRCDEIAKGVNKSLESIPSHISVACRLQGTNQKRGIKILKDSGLEAATDLEEVVNNIVKLTQDGDLLEHIN